MKLLIISYLSPADKITGGFRASSFTQYFPEAGIDITLLTSNPELKTNEALRERYNIKEVEIVRSIKIRKIGYKLKILALLENLKLDTLFFFPDIFRFWNRRARAKAQKIIESDEIDAILVTAPPHSSFWFAYKLAKKTKLPLILDYRDPLTGCPFYYYPPIIKQIVRRKERKIVNYARLKITVGKEYSDVIVKNLKLKENEFHIVHNGFYEEDLPDLTVEKGSKFTISYFGHFYLLRQRAFEALVDGMSNVIQKHNLMPEDICLQYAGKTSRKTLQKIIKPANIDGNFKDLGLLLEEELFNEIGKSTLNVVLIPPKVNYNLPSKMYDYAFCNSHILLIGEKGAASNWCEKVEQVYTLVPIDSNKIEEEIWKLYNRWKKGELHFGSNSEKVNQFKRKNNALQLAEIIKKELQG